MKAVNGYKLVKDFTSDGAGFCRWTFAEKNGHEYFIKEFISPKYPVEGHELSAATIEKKRKQCERFYESKKHFYDELRKCRTGNIVFISDFFREGSRYYAVTDKVEAKNLSVEDVAFLSDEKKLVITRALLYNFAVLHAHKIIHADVRPENILIKETASGYYTVKLIDFDASYFEEESPEEIFGDMVYLAPETRLFLMEEQAELTTKIDIFALGILLHQYWSGALPTLGADYQYPFEAVLDDAPILLDLSLPPVVQIIIQSMLQKDINLRPNAKSLLEDLDAYYGDVIPKSVTSDGTKKDNISNNMRRTTGFYIPTDLD